MIVSNRISEVNAEAPTPKNLAFLFLFAILTIREQKENRRAVMSVQAPAAIRVGTAGWSYPHWSGLVYPKTHWPGFHQLEAIAKNLDTVEINSSFYQPLKPEVVRLWAKKVEANPGFLFTAKLHQQFTHNRVLDEAEIASFKAGLAPLVQAKKLG